MTADAATRAAPWMMNVPKRGRRPHTMRRLGRPAAIAVLLFAACGGDGDRVNSTAAVAATTGQAVILVSGECDEAMAAAADEADIDRADPLIIATLSACLTAAEWLEALRQHPAAMGVTDAEFIGTIDLEAACGNDASTPVCADARERGLIG